CADQLIELLPAQGTRWAGDSDDVGVGRQWSVTAAEDEDRVKAVAVRLGQDVGGTGEVVGDEADRRHVSEPPAACGLRTSAPRGAGPGHRRRPRVRRLAAAGSRRWR